MITPISARDAEIQADSLCLYSHLSRPLARLLWSTIANPDAGPDTLLILATALRSVDPLAPNTGYALNSNRIANAIADLACTRTSRIEDKT